MTLRAVAARSGANVVLDRLLDEYEPAERRNRRMHGEHLTALHALGNREHLVVPRTRRARCPGCLDLRRLGEVALLQHEPQIGMGDQLVVRIHHVRIAGAPGADARHHVPDRPDVDFGHRDLGRSLVRRHGHRDERLGLVPEVSRAEIDLFRFRPEELGRVGKILTASHRVEREARRAQLLLAGEIQMADLGDRRHVAQQAQEVDLALFREGGGARLSSRPSGRCRPCPGRIRRSRPASCREAAGRSGPDTARSRSQPPAPSSARAGRSTAWPPDRRNRARRRCSRTARLPPVSAERPDTCGTARAASTASSLDHVGAEQDLAWNVEREEPRRLQIDRQRDFVGGLDRECPADASPCRILATMPAAWTPCAYRSGP